MPVARSAATSPMTLPNLNPCPEHALTNVTFWSLPSGPMAKLKSGVFE